MGVRRVTAPGVEPIDLAEAKVHLFLDGTSQDADVEKLIAASRAQIERATGRSLVTQDWQLTLDRFPCADDPQGAVILLPRGDVQMVTGIGYLDVDGALQTLDASVYVLDASVNPARVSLDEDETWPSTRGRAGAVTVAYRAGYGDEPADVPEDLRHAIRLLLGHWHRNREGVVTGTISTAIQHALDALIDSYRIDR